MMAACFFSSQGLTFTSLYKLKRFITVLGNYYRLDTRALSLMRIGMAFIILADLLIRGSDLKAMYTDQGWWPCRVVGQFGFQTGYWSLHLLSGSYAWALFLFSIHFIFALLLLIGYRTRLATTALWLLYISLHNRNLFINQSGDDLLRLLLFWGIFLPWNAHYSIDSKKNTFKKRTQIFASLGYYSLISSVYIFTVALKTGKEWVSDHTAVYYALSLEQLKLPFIADIIYPHQGLMQFLTVFVYYTEALIPLLILVPSRKGTFRILALILLLILQLGIGFTLYVGLFFLINIVSALALLPSKAMDKIEYMFRAVRFFKYSTELNKKYLPRPYCPKLRKLTGFFGLLVILFSFFTNLSTLHYFSYEPVEELRASINFFRFDQNWGMFSPNILKRDGWYVQYGMDSIGRQWDMIRNEDYVSFEKPKSVLSIHKNDRWRKLTENMQRDDMYFLRPLYCKYLLRTWNRSHPEKRLNSLTLYYMMKETLPDYKYTNIKKQVYCVCDNS